MEIWKKTNYENTLISNYGRVHNTKTGNYLQGTATNGYVRVSLINQEGKTEPQYVHRLVAHAFCDGYVEGYDVHHKDGNQSNNHASNLEWTTRKINNSYRKPRTINPPISQQEISRFEELRGKYSISDIKDIMNEEFKVSRGMSTYRKLRDNK